MQKLANPVSANNSGTLALLIVLLRFLRPELSISEGVANSHASMRVFVPCRGFGGIAVEVIKRRESFLVEEVATVPDLPSLLREISQGIAACKDRVAHERHEGCAPLGP